jgi:hypothetical protein
MVNKLEINSDKSDFGGVMHGSKLLFYKCEKCRWVKLISVNDEPF